MIQVRWTVGAVVAFVLLLGGCASEPNPPMGISYQLAFTAVIIEGLSDERYPNPDPVYAETPPCVHPGDTPIVPGAQRCSPRVESHVAYWTSRPDRYRTACRGQPSEYCNELAGMIPHCHGFGKWRFCHAHPGGDQPHDHIHDLEFAAK